MKDDQKTVFKGDVVDGEEYINNNPDSEGQTRPVSSHLYDMHGELRSRADGFTTQKKFNGGDQKMSMTQPMKEESGGLLPPINMRGHVTQFEDIEDADLSKAPEEEITPIEVFKSAEEQATVSPKNRIEDEMEAVHEQEEVSPPLPSHNPLETNSSEAISESVLKEAQGYLSNLMEPQQRRSELRESGAAASSNVYSSLEMGAETY